MMEFAWPWAALLWPLPFLVRRMRPTPLLAPAALAVPSIEAFADDDRHTRPRVAFVLLWVAWSLAVAAATRPQWTGDTVDLPATGRDLLLAVDISGSMSMEDVTLDGEPALRLAAVKSVLEDFIERRRGDRIGLILFGTHAYLQAPLTFDLATVRRFLVEAPVGIAGGRTAIGDAVALAVKRLHGRPSDSRVLVLLSDGSNNAGAIAPREAAAMAALEGVRIHAVGFGSEAMEVSGALGVRTVNPSLGLDEPTLADLAHITGGSYFRARDTAALTRIYGLIDALEPAQQDPDRLRPVRVLYHWPLAVAGALLLALCVLYGPGAATRVSRSRSARG